jgi:16S rRNA (guanine527-N7)-methyltransferase
MPVPDALHLDVSRETAARLDTYATLLRKWNSRINLVAPSTLATAASRHFADSAQFLGCTPLQKGLWVDVGSGGGFPGMVIAILAREARPGLAFALVESDARKAEFLREVARATGTPVRIISERIESLDPLGADILSARAVAPLGVLTAWAKRHLAPSGVALFAKGRQADREIAEAGVDPGTIIRHPSTTDPDAAILEVKGLAGE